MRIISDRLFIWFAVLSLVFIFAAGNMAYHYSVVIPASSDPARVVTREAHPMRFWVFEGFVVVIAVGLATLALRRAKKIGTESKNLHATAAPTSIFGGIIRKIAIGWFLLALLLLLFLLLFPPRPESRKQNSPNQAREATATAGMSAAGQSPRQP